MTDRKPKTFTGKGPCSVCGASFTIIASGAVMAHKDQSSPIGARCAGAGLPPKVVEASPPAAVEPSPSAPPSAPVALPPVGSMVRVGSADSESGRVWRHLPGGKFLLTWPDGTEGEHVPSDIVPELDTPPDTGSALADDGQPLTDAQAVRVETILSAPPTPAPGLAAALAEVAAPPPVEPTCTQTPLSPAAERVMEAGRIRREAKESTPVAEDPDHQAAILRALIPDTAELTQTATGWDLRWDGVTRSASCISDLVCDLMADAATSIHGSTPPAADCDAQRRRIAVMEGQLDASREEVGRLLRVVRDGQADSGRLAVEVADLSAELTREQTISRRALDLVSLLRPT